MISVLLPDTMRECDRLTVASGVSSADLVSRAAEELFGVCSCRGESFALFCGPGNNGADGYALACLLSDAGKKCVIIASSQPKTPECIRFSEKCAGRGITVLPGDAASLPDIEKVDVVIDCIAGNGFSGAPKGCVGALIDLINRSGAYVICADINSGLDPLSGRGPKCVRSDLTAAIGFPKTGHYLNDAKDCIGELVTLDVGIGLHGAKAVGVIEKRDARALLAGRKRNSHKGSYGYIAVIGGCSEYSGAAKIANLGTVAIKSGCGVVKLAVPKRISPWVAPYLLESTLFELSDNCGSFVFDKDETDRLLSNVKAAALGMGWGKNENNLKLLSYILSEYAIPLVIDADGLNALAGNLSLLDRTKCRVIITPHPAELSRLSGAGVNEILSDPIGHAEKFAREHHVTILLKGCASVITDGTDTYISDSGCAGMAVGGSGDLLSGVIAGMLGYCPASPLTVASAAYINGLAGEIAERRSNPVSMSAGDTAAALPDAISEILNDMPDNR